MLPTTLRYWPVELAFLCTMRDPGVLGRTGQSFSWICPAVLLSTGQSRQALSLDLSRSNTLNASPLDAMRDRAILFFYY
jgi:hypothetical protein